MRIQLVPEVPSSFNCYQHDHFSNFPIVAGVYLGVLFVFIGENRRSIGVMAMFGVGRVRRVPQPGEKGGRTSPDPG